MRRCSPLRHDPRTAHIPVVVLASNMDDQTMAGALAAGANVYLAKPPDMPSLLSAVERLVTIKPTGYHTVMIDAHNHLNDPRLLPLSMRCWRGCARPA